MVKIAWARIRQWAQHEALRPDLTRSARSAVAFTGSFLATWHLGWPSVAMFAAMSAQNIAMIDVKGDYRARFCLLLAMLVVLTGSVGLGALAWSGGLTTALAGTVIIAAGSGLWRHLSSDYGPATAVISALLFFVSQAGEAHGGHVVPAVFATLAGGALGILLQVALWPWRAQHPLRRTVAESWLAMAAVFEAIAGSSEKTTTNVSALREAEGALRTAIDLADRTLISARLNMPAKRGATGRRKLVDQLIELNLWVPRLAMAASAVHTLLEGAGERQSDARRHSGWRHQLAISAIPLFAGLANLGRSVALAVVSRQPGNLATCEVRLRRLDGILRGLKARALALRSPLTLSAAAEADADNMMAHLAKLLDKVGERLTGMEAVLRSTVERAGERAAFPLELLDLKTWQLRPLAAAINLKPRPDPVLLRFTLRLTVLMTGGVCAFYLLKIPHGYWLPLTIVVVLQPDYGATRTRAAQRLIGTVAGSLFASILLWLRLPPVVELGVITVCVFLFCFLVRRNYAAAVFFVTVFVVLLIETSGAQMAGVTLERTGATLAGGLVALGAAALFWPVWEKDRLPPLLAKALRANRDYLATLVDRLAHGGGGGEDEPLIQAKRAAESANATVFASLRRFYGDPRNRRDRLELAAVLANGTQRLTRIATLLMLHVHPAENPLTATGAKSPDALFSPSHQAVAQIIMHALEALADEISRGLDPLHTREQRRAIMATHALALDTLEPPPPPPLTHARCRLGHRRAWPRGSRSTRIDRRTGRGVAKTTATNAKTRDFLLATK